jgi:hypothetical protein
LALVANQLIFQLRPFGGQRRFGGDDDDQAGMAAFGPRAPQWPADDASPNPNIMRDLDALLNSLVNIDRDSLVAILSSEAEAAERLANSIRTRTSTQRLKRLQAVERAARINRILLFFRHDETGPYMSDADLALCKSLERKLIIRG